MVVDFTWGSNVFPIKKRCADLTFGAVSQVEGYWDGLSAGTDIPARAAVDPRGMEDALEYAFILERIGRGVARFRLAGMHLNELMGMEVRGMPLTAMFEPQARVEIGETVETICTRPKLMTMELISSGGIGQRALEARMFLAPLRDDEGKVTRILGCLQSKGRMGRPPHRFLVRNVSSKKIQGYEYEMPVRETAYELAEPQSVFRHKVETKRPDDIRPALRLISNDS